ncbi:MAG: 2-dehydro-3-deoxygluconokinase [Cryptosporangiaceae bacterium]|nr:2-dehydro-3-deoxygluconokinase [Cryptosporangiaceae bacterium]
MREVLAVGECMLELRHMPGSGEVDLLRLGYAGDTYNTAVYARRVADLLGVDAEVGFLTGIGSDEYSAGMRSAWAAERVRDRSVLVEGHLPGLYTVRVDGSGERRFGYWRSESAARALFAGTDWVAGVGGDVIHLSGITLQIASEPARAALLDRIAALRASGSRVSLDTNYRAAGWPGRAEAAKVMDQFCQSADIVLATWDDESALHGCGTLAQAADRLAALGPAEVVVKDGPAGAHVLTGGRFEHVPAARAESVTDTTAAGDSFAGGYLAARLAGRDPVAAAAIAAQVAAVVVAHPGAIVPAGTPLLTEAQLREAR